MTFTPRFPATMPLAELIREEYVPRAGKRRRTKENPGTPLTRNRVLQLEYFTRLFRAYLHRDPLVADLTPDTLEDFEAWHRAAFPTKTGQWFGIDCRALLRFVEVVPDARRDNGRKGRRLSEDADTLWHICKHEYFPRSLRIRSDKTKLAYKMAIADFKEFLGREPTVQDLNEEDVTRLVVWMRDQQVGGKPRFAAKTLNERAARLKALWNWLAKRRRTEMFPTVDRVPEPRRLPRAWTEDELSRLFASCRQERGEVVEGVAAADWWLGLHWFLWSTGERIGAVLACRWEWLDWSTGHIQIDAEHRKGKDADFLHRLRPECLDVLARMKPAGHDLIFPWPFHQVTFYQNYGDILERAGLPRTRKDKTHKIRRSVASHLQAAGVDACAALGHSSPDVTRKSYLDPRIVAPRSPADVLFSPLAGVALLPRIERPARLEYHPRPETEGTIDVEWL